MNEETPSAPAGWYPTPDGRQRYWDGQAWLDIPAPAGTTSVAPSGVPSRKTGRKWVWITAIVVAAVIVIAGGAAIAINVRHSQQVAVEAAAAKKRAADEAQRKADEQAAAEAARQKADDQERASRALIVPEIEKSIKKMAKEHVADGIIDGPVEDVSCSPVGGGSTDDLTEQTTVFDCFVATKDNGDGSMSGYHYHATVNWTTEEFTYGLGEP